MDIERHLRPLLSERSDLVLIGRMLIIRPVRHVLRGALFDPGDDKTSCRLLRYMQALYDPVRDSGYGDYLQPGPWQVWQPHFEPLIVDVLAEDVFAPLGTMTTLADFADALAGTGPFFSARVRALVLAGERDRAAEYVRELEQHQPGNPQVKSWAETQWAFLAKDIRTVCAEFHAKEAETVKAMTLDAIWEPTPFPVELPVADRARSAEPGFLPTPWISRPSWLLGSVPDRPGDIRFAKDALHRKGGAILVVPLSRAEAESRHRNREPYVLAARLPERVSLVLRPTGGQDRNDPACPGEAASGFAGLVLNLYGADHSVFVSFADARHADELLRLESVAVRERTTGRDIWSCHISSKESETRIHDEREVGNRIVTKRPLTETEWDLITCPIAGFGEFEDVWACARAWLRYAGFGDVT